MQEQARDHLRGCALFGRLDEQRLERLCAMATQRRFQAGEVIVEPGDVPPGMFLVLEGQVRVFNLAPSGKEHVLHLATAGKTFLEVAVLGGFPAPASAQAVMDTTCLLLPTAPLKAALAADHALCLQLMTGLALWVRQLVGLLEDVVLRDATGRVASYLQELRAQQGTNELLLPGMKKHLASHLNLTSETLSRTLRRLNDTGLIRADGSNVIRIIDDAALDVAASGFAPRL